MHVAILLMDCATCPSFRERIKRQLTRVIIQLVVLNFVNESSRKRVIFPFKDNTCTIIVRNCFILIFVVSLLVGDCLLKHRNSYNQDIRRKSELEYSALIFFSTGVCITTRVTPFI